MQGPPILASPLSQQQERMMAAAMACFYGAVAFLWFVAGSLLAINWHLDLPAGPAGEFQIAIAILYVLLIFVSDTVRWIGRAQLERHRDRDRRPQI